MVSLRVLLLLLVVVVLTISEDDYLPFSILRRLGKVFYGQPTAYHLYSM